MDSYVQYIESGVYRHKHSEDGDQWPLVVQERVQDLQAKIKLPSWVKRGPYPHVDLAILPLLDQLATSGVEGFEQEPEEDMQNGLWSIFGTVLSNCNAIRAVFESETLDGRQHSKASFLVVLIRNVLMGAHNGLLSRGNASVALPLHASGTASPLMKYMPKSFCAPLVIMSSETTTDAQQIDGENIISCSNLDSSTSDDPNKDSHLGSANLSGGDGGHRVDDENNDGDEDDHAAADDDDEDSDDDDDHSSGSSEEEEEDSDTESSESYDESQEITMSDFLKNCMQPHPVDDNVDGDEDEDEDRNTVLPLEFNQHFISYPSTAVVPSACDVAVFCMAEHTRLGLLMTSLLYQRRVWRIDEPLFGIGFSELSTVVKLYVGWLDDEIPPHCVLPRVHIGEIETNVVLDLSLPLMALTLAQLLLGLKSRISLIQDYVTHLRNSELHPSDLLSWRVDTCLTADTASDKKDVIATWIASQQYIRSAMSPKRDAKRKTTPKESPSPDREHEGNTETHEQAPATTHSTESASSNQGSTQARSRADTITPRHFKHLSSAGDRKETKEHEDAGNTNEQDHADADEAGSEPSDSEELSDTEESSATASSTQLTSHQPSCSGFAKEAAKNNNVPIFNWMFDRGVIPRSFASDDIFFEEYNRLVGLIWPVEWKTKADLPSTDRALGRYLVESLESANDLRKKGQVTELEGTSSNGRIFNAVTANFSTILQSSYNSRYNMARRSARQGMSEADWRHDMDSLLSTFFHGNVGLSEQMARMIISNDARLPQLKNSTSSFELTLAFPKTNVMDQEHRKRIYAKLVRSTESSEREWTTRQGYSSNTADEEFARKGAVASTAFAWSSGFIQTKGPASGRCDALGRLQVCLPDRIRLKDLKPFSLVSFGERRGVKNQASPPLLSSEYVIGSGEAQAAEFSGDSGEARSPQTQDPDTQTSTLLYDVFSAAVPATSPTETLQKTRKKLKFLDLPVLVLEYKKADIDKAQGTNQLRMCLVSCVKFLATLGITNFPVFGAQLDGPNLCFIAAVQKTAPGEANGDIVHIDLFERLATTVDLSTAIGAWHCATILVRLSRWHAELLQDKFSKVTLFAGRTSRELPKWKQKRMTKSNAKEGNEVAT